MARVTPSSGNVFKDIGLPDADILMAKADLVIRISQIIKRRRLTQGKAAEILGVNQSKVSALLRGHLAYFSMDRLFRFLNALGNDIEITIKPRRTASRLPPIRVV